MELLEEYGLVDAGESILTDEELGELLDTGSVTIEIARKKYTIILTAEITQ